ncbi:SAVED domain-containing protein [Evansella clarkii]|uniref:SAVED domain-containing protein n=1 Tax=Evansella clarkii TaxID=79879 RepID=UPI0009986EA1|nr:SAVED domain-containing protein [Evansella clarkii]
MSRDPFKLSTAEDRSLWVSSGGMCAKCKTALILDDVDAKVNIGERAHIIGKAKGKGKQGGPRREFAEEFDITDENIDSLNNIMLMCSQCHHTIDTNIKAYPPTDLFYMKEEHESWVREQLSKKNKAIVVVHKRKNPMPVDSILLSKETNCLLLDAVSLQEEFTDFTEEGWKTAKNDNEDFFRKVVNSKRENEGTYLFVFPLSPIPLLIHLGSLISDTTAAVVHQFDRDTQMWCHENANLDKNVGLPEVKISEYVHDKLVVTVQVSGNIHEQDIKDAVDGSFQSLDIKIDKPELNAVLYKNDVEVLKSAFRKEVYRLQGENQYSEIHLFYFGPAGLAVELGRCINQNMLPVIHLYEYKIRDEKKYHSAITI